MSLKSESCLVCVTLVEGGHREVQLPVGGLQVELGSLRVTASDGLQFVDGCKNDPDKMGIMCTWNCASCSSLSAMAL